MTSSYAFSPSALSALRVADDMVFASATYRAHHCIPPSEYDRLVACNGDEWYHTQANERRMTDEYQQAEEKIRIEKQYQYDQAAWYEECDEKEMIIDALDTDDTRQSESMRVFMTLRNTYVRVEDEKLPPAMFDSLMMSFINDIDVTSMTVQKMTPRVPVAPGQRTVMFTATVREQKRGGREGEDSTRN